MTLRHPRITRFKQAAALSTWLILLVTLVPIVLHGIIVGTFVLPFTLTKAELAWVLLAMPVVNLFCSWVLHGLTTGDWSPPAIDAILQLFQGAPEPTTNGPGGTPIPAPPPPSTATVTLFQDHLASMRPIEPVTDEPPPRPLVYRAP